MGEVIPFRKREVPKQPRPKPSNGKYWRVVDFKDGPPREHPLVKRGPRGRPLVAKNQIWVSGGTGELFIVTRVEPNVCPGFYHCVVYYKSYRGKRGEEFDNCSAELSFRQNFQVWEDHLISHAQPWEKFGRLSVEDPTSPYYDQGERGKEAARNFFELDENGYRIDD
jgi:hypothetical protein